MANVGAVLFVLAPLVLFIAATVWLGYWEDV